MTPELLNAIVQAAALIAPHMPPIDASIDALYGSTQEAREANRIATIESIAIRIRRSLELG